MRRTATLLLLLTGPSLQADAIDDWIKAAMEKDHVPGVGVAIVRPDGSADIRGYGVANLEYDVPFSVKTVHRIASISKQFCAYAILKLAKEGKLSLDDPLRKFFPKGPEAWSKITLTHALAHRSGIAEPGTAFDYRREYTTDEYVEILAKKPLSEEPGKTYRYNNFAYGLLGMVVGITSGEPIEQYVRKHVFDPLGMAATHYWDAEAVVPHRSAGYRWRDGKHVIPLMIRPRVFHGSGGILSSLEDMVRYELELRKPKVLDSTLLDQQWKVYGGGERGYGFGWQVDRRDGKLVLTHTGGTFGYTSVIHRDVTDGWTIILFRNAQTTEVAAWGADVLKLAKETKGFPSREALPVLSP
ncbi:MAG: beta-lactamase family protein [Methanoregulaceae archaeon]|nr:beta-lactamase family protein [Methanoregulaceae archaeon]